MLRPDFQTVLANQSAEKNTLRLVALYQMDELMEKLKILNYEKSLLREMKMKPINRYYFTRPTNPGEQFYMFTSICAWLIQRTGRDFEQPQEFHDPNATVANIVQILQEMDISTDFPTNKLMQGAGFVCIYVLDCLATQACKVNVPNLQALQIEAEEEVVTEIESNENEIILEKVEEEQNAMLSDEDSEEENNAALLDLKFKTGSKLKNFSILSKQNASSTAETTLTDNENWRLEFERVLPQLKVVVKSDPRDWRAHWEQMKLLRGNINSATEETELQLKRLQNDITFAMEKIESREKHLNNDLASLIEQFKKQSIEYTNIRNEIKDNDVEKADLEQRLTKTVHEFENVKVQMEQRGNTMSDGSPLINIKKTIAKIKEEIVEMELEIGVMKHTIDQDILKQNAIYAELEPVASIF